MEVLGSQFPEQSLRELDSRLGQSSLFALSNQGKGRPVFGIRVGLHGD